MVRIVTDSTADLKPEQQQDITIVPLNVHFGDQVFRDGVDLGGPEFFKKLKTASQLPRTSQPSVGAFEDAFRQIRAAGDDVVAIHLSAKVSGTHNAALMAAQAVDPGHIEVVDSNTVSMAMGFIVLEAAQAARQGAARREVVDRVTALVPKARVLAGIDTLTYLERGGRIGKAQALLGSLLNVKPLITFRDGEVEPLGRARSKAQMMQRLVQVLERDGRLTHLAVLHGAAPTEAATLRSMVAPHYPELQIPFAEIGPVIGTHAGPGAIGFTYLVA